MRGTQVSIYGGILFSLILALPTTTFAVTSLSQAVVTSAETQTISLINKTIENKADTTDVASARVALATLFANLQESGLNDQIQAKILASKDDFLRYGISSKQIEKQHGQLEKQGVKLSLNQYRNSAYTSSEQRESLIALIEKNGIVAVEQQLLNALAAHQTSLNSGASRWMNFSSLNLGPKVLFRRTAGLTCGQLASIMVLAIAVQPELAAVLGPVAALYSLEDSFGWC